MRPANNASKSLKARSTGASTICGQAETSNCSVARRTSWGELTRTVLVMSKSLRRMPPTSTPPSVGGRNRSLGKAVIAPESRASVQGPPTTRCTVPIGDSGVCDSDSYVKARQYRGVIGGALQQARRAIDVATGAALSQCGGGQHQIDAQALIAAQGSSAVVPPTEGLRWLLEFAEHVAEADLQQLAQRLALGLGLADQHRSGPGLRVVHVAILRCDVEIAEHDQVRVAREFLTQPYSQCLEPAQLVLVFV